MLKFNLNNNKFKMFLKLFAIFTFVFIFIIYMNPKEKSNTLTDEEIKWLDNNGPIIYAADENAPPLRYVDSSDDQYKGVLIDYMHFLSIELGINIELYPLLWEDAISELATGNTDICDMFPSVERNKSFLFSDPIYNLRGILAIRSNLSSEIKSLDDLNGKTMAIQKDDYASEYLTINYPNINQHFVENLEQALILVSQGKADASLGDEPVMVFQMDKHNLDSHITIIEEPIYENYVALAVSKSKPELVPILNKGISSLNNDNVLEKIQQKWFGISAPIVSVTDIGIIKNYIFIIIVIVAIVLVLMTIWNNSLKTQIKLRTKELEDSHKELQAVFDGMAEYMLVLDQDKMIRNINKVFLNLLGKSKKEIIGKYYQEILGYVSSNKLGDLIDKAIEEGVHTAKEIQLESLIYQVSVHPLNSLTSDTKDVLVFLYDVTNEKINTNKMLQANKMFAIGELAAGIAHEIRNPLGIIRNHSYIINNLYSEATS